MGKQQSVRGGRPHRLSTALSDEEAQFVDSVRGSLTRSEYLRWLVVREKRKHGDPRAQGGQMGTAAQHEGWRKASMGAHVDVAVVKPGEQFTLAAGESVEVESEPILITEK